MSLPTVRDRRHGPRRPASRLDGAGRSAAGARTGARPTRPTRRMRRSTASRYGDSGVASLGEARAHRRLDAIGEHHERTVGSARRAAAARAHARPAARSGRRGRSLVNRFGAGRPAAAADLDAGRARARARRRARQGRPDAGDGRRDAARPGGRAVDPQPPTAGPARARSSIATATSWPCPCPASTIAVNPRQVLDAAGTVDILGDLLDLSDERRAELLDRDGRRATAGSSTSPARPIREIGAADQLARPRRRQPSTTRTAG